MASAIKGSPNTYDFGETFNYAQWTENTVLTLCNVNWNNDYRDVWRASDQGAVDTWIDGTTDKLVIPNVSLAKFNRNVRVNTPVNKAMGYNYLRAVNGTNPVGNPSRNYYYFILDTIQVNPNTTELVLQLDVWQTFGYEVTFGNCFIERGHIGIANTHAFDNYGRDYLSIPEGLDTGGEYRIVKTAKDTLMDVTSGTHNHSVLVVSTVDLTANPGTVTAPLLRTAPGDTVDGLPSGASFYVFPTITDFTKFMTEYSDMPWVTQGILSITVVPDITRYHANDTLYDYASIMTFPAIDSSGNQTYVHADWKMYQYPPSLSSTRKTALATAWRDTLLNTIPSKYRILKKLLTYPYCLIELTTWTGAPLVIRPEAWSDPDATVREQAVMVPPGQRVAYMPWRYNADDANTTATDTDDQGEYLDMATTIAGFPSMPIVNSMAISYLASNKNGLAFEFRSADWAQQKALRGAQATSDVANADIRNTSRQALNQNAAQMNAMSLSTNALMGNMALSQATNAMGLLGGVASAGAFGGATEDAGIANAAGKAAGLVSGPMHAATDAMLQADLAVNSTGARSRSAEASMETQGSIRDTNVSLARFSAKGDYANTVAGINAKIQDSRMLQPSVSGQFGGDAMNLAHSNVEVSARWKMIDNAAIRRIGNFWLRYGYAIDQFGSIPSDFQCMSKFTYWKLSETYITAGKIPEQFKQTIRGIFEKGVTVWAKPDYIGTTDLADNQPKTGISLE